MLLKEIRAIAGETVVFSPHDQAAEHANTSWLGAPPHERMGMSADEVVAAFEETASALRDQVAEMAYRGPATFYVWHDEQAGQLRCSIRSCERDNLPFGARYRTTTDLHGIVIAFLQDRAPGAIAWGELEPMPFHNGRPAEVAEFRVWAVDLRS